jgi:hypothetical protein
LAEALFSPHAVGRSVGADAAIDPYVYAGDNPATLTDPSGKDAFDAELDSNYDENVFGPVFLAGIYALADALDWLFGYSGYVGAVNPADPRTAQQIISAERQGTIMGQFPKEFLGNTPAEIIQAGKSGSNKANAKRAWKLLNDNRWVRGRRVVNP